MDDEEDIIMMDYHPYTATSHPSNLLTSKNCYCSVWNCVAQLLLPSLPLLNMLHYSIVITWQ